MKYLVPVSILVLGWASTALAFTAKDTPYQPKEERQAQNALPMASGVVWNTLMQAKIKYADKPPYISATLTPDVKAMSGKVIHVDGFMLPMDSGETSSHFLLSKRTPTCPFCPPGEPNEVIEVYSSKPIKYDDTMLTMEGTFQLINNTDNGVFFVLKRATLLKNTKVDYSGALKGTGGARLDGSKDVAY